jgi:hypothetical protein
VAEVVNGDRFEDAAALTLIATAELDPRALRTPEPVPSINALAADALTNAPIVGEADAFRRIAATLVERN